VPDDSFKIYSGGWIAGGMGAVAKQHLFTNFVYYSSVVIHDPISNWFDDVRNDLESPPDLVADDGKTIVQTSEVFNLKGEGYAASRLD
jgi:hypothetical protein